ncbi:Peptidoglycan N-acetylglucosamine deacetylase [Fimbriiglobus ruber]|uniref:Peptidoglycan N-acetylglucosamine deacetylase n=1 Tax=Fimbriiglobus ruber TaxID=1908690 RepID=A0A225DQB0_9BACT|nr:Peptidoglycan N-acetylglucosamine deacetylase [Fimbriiglobus ruber]
MTPTFAARPGWAKRLIPDRVVRRQASRGATIQLTFDDGPDPETTPGVLDRLEEYGLRATFFLVGNRVARAPHVVRRIREAGHVLGNHTFSHAVPSYFSTRAAWREVATCQRIVAEAAGAAPTLFRPPLGRLTPGLVAAAWAHGLAVTNWSLDSGDWQCRSAEDADRCARETLDRIRPGDILLFHDDHPYIGRILDVVLPVVLGSGPA